MMQIDRRIDASEAAQTAQWLKQMGLQQIGPLGAGDGEVLLTDKTLRDFFDGCSQMKINRLRESKGFTEPLRFGGRLYTPRSQFYAWLKSQIEAGDDPRMPHHLKGRLRTDQPAQEKTSLMMTAKKMPGGMRPHTGRLVSTTAPNVARLLGFFKASIAVSTRGDGDERDARQRGR